VEATETRVRTDELRMQFERDGFVVIENALSEDTVAALSEAVQRVWAEQRPNGSTEPLHLIGFVMEDPRFLELIDWPTTFPLVCDLLGWNIFVYHTHLDVHPPLTDRSLATKELPWHQDGRRIVHDVDTYPQPRLSLKVSFWLTDLPSEEYGPIHVLPGSHTRTERPEPGERGIPVLLEAGSALVHDRRVWHARGYNLSDRTREAVFIGYTYRWIRCRDAVRRPENGIESLTPVRRQLLDLPFPRANGDPYYVPQPEDVPLREIVERRQEG
jgi:ectoine hydroxylase